MTRDEYLKELNKAFGDFKFFEKDHHYEYKGQRVGMSVTRLIEEYTNEFDAQAVAEKVVEKNKKNYEYAKTQLKLYNPLELNTNNCMEQYKELQQVLKQPLTIQEVLDEWEYKNKWACHKGHLGHEYSQSLWNGQSPYYYGKMQNESENIALEKIFNQADNFYKDYEDRLEHLADEYVIGSEEYDIASAIDHLFINKLTGGLVLVDYKTNSDIHKNERYAKDMKVPLHHLKDFTLNHYYIQLSIYKYLVEKYTNLKIEDMFIVYFSENIENYEIIEIPYLKGEVETILERRRSKNFMENKKSVVILVVGKSGAGKSASLRNFTNDEVGVINVLGKELPFKNDFKMAVTDNYEKILNGAKNSKKKTIVIDDSNYLITREFVRKASLTGYQKFTDMAVNYDELIEGKQDTKGNKIKDGLKDIQGGKTIYMFMHEETDDDGNIKPKTIGKMLDEKINIQGLFTIVIRAVNDNGNYKFLLKSNGQDCVKTPIGMFEQSEMENDLKEVDKIIRDYYDLDKDEEKKEGEE